MRKTLTARNIKTLRAVDGQRTDFFDPKVPGLCLRVTPNGVKSWSLLYRRHRLNRRLTIGDAQVVGLAEAREKARDAIRVVQKGGDPGLEKTRRKEAKTIDDLIPDFIERHCKKRNRSWKHTEWLLTTKVRPVWKGRAIEDITRRDVRLLVEKMAEKTPTLANRTVAALSRMFRFALDDDLITASPAVGISKPGQEQSRDRVLTSDEIRTLWAKFNVLSSPLSAFFKLRLLLAQRGIEVASMRWQDVDTKAGWWTIPAAVSKNKLQHRCPLGPSALSIIESLRPETPDASAYVLEDGRGKKQHAEATKTFGVEDFRGHDLRRTAASMMASGGVPRLTISKILNHVETGVTAVYDRHSYDAEKATALAWWDRKLMTILEETDARNVLPFVKA